MINVPLALAAIASAPGDDVVYTKEQAMQLLHELEVGQRARIALINIKSYVTVAASAAGSAL